MTRAQREENNESAALIQLPLSWIMLEIGDVADVISGGTPKANDPTNFAGPGQEIAWLTPADLSKYSEKYISHGARDLSQSGYATCSAKLVSEGSILFSSRAPIGYVAIAANKISTNQGFKNFVFPGSVDPSYAYYFLRSIRHIAESRGTGTTFKELSGAAAKKLPFCMAPVTEQKVIAEKLDTLLAQVETTKARLERIPHILKRFRQSVLVAAVSGRLTEEWREINHEVDTTWEKVSFSKIILKLRSGAADRPNEDSKGIPILRSSAIRPLEIDFSDIRYLENVSTLKEDNYLKQGDLLFTRLSGSAEYVGNCAMVKSVDRQYQYPDRLFCARLKEPRYGRYLEYFFASQNFRDHIQNSLKSSAGHQRITLDVIKTAVVVLPPLEEQTEIVRRADQLFTHADRIEQQVQGALERVNNLTPSILAKAFRGELTEQWRRDNPELISGDNSAAALLARIQAERAATAKPMRRKAKT
ncbi:restriction endonuclease subunit S [Halopseudomonas bauzanensis]|uniref:Type I restriction enzyme, S subunit n=1 Tax=Halopseudomonas bauzanensis TaxID=653930 RepID=A0A1H9SYZ7_9GAMM|nr:restriction endonuclease subunit S [Halopseudomonas bauzanensis]SER90232.1 type I restriction enzyme, S subunit [Halopseudomonas bauzanensis]SFL91105.1 type I restriction enzyme, S subunit [Halopseudomonas bauzanensis]